MKSIKDLPAFGIAIGLSLFVVAAGVAPPPLEAVLAVVRLTWEFRARD